MNPLRFSFSSSTPTIRSLFTAGSRAGQRWTSTTVTVDLSDVTEQSGPSSSIRFKTGEMARFADGCVVSSIGDTSVLVTAVSRKRTSGVASFLPLTVDYRQKAAAAGRIPTNYYRRELGPSPGEILTGRVIDRSIRPMFPSSYSADTQVMCNLLAVDGLNDPDVLSINGASAALAVSDIPWNGPVAAVRVGYIPGSGCVVNPTRRQMLESLLNLVITSANGDRVVMIEMAAEELPLAEVQQAIKVGKLACQRIISSIQELVKLCGKPKREESPVVPPETAIVEAVSSLAESKFRAVLTDFTHDKMSRDRAVQQVWQETAAQLKESFPDAQPGAIETEINRFYRHLFRQIIFQTGIRCDGRSLSQLRPISCAVDVYKPLHGSALFQRGQTQVFCAVTFDSLESAFRADPISQLTGDSLKDKRFLLQYEFPPYATNEISTGKGQNRRELGHGALAEKGLRPLIPKNYPFTIRLTAEVLESNGSSSMASVCGGSLALMDAGVPIREPCAGVAMGLITSMETEDANNGQYPTIRDHRILTDISGIEDYLGDMDFKIAGTKKGFTAMQLDLKIPGIPSRIVCEALDGAIRAKADILAIMDEAISEPRIDPKENHPVSEKQLVPINKRNKFIGVGGMNLRKLENDVGVRVTQLDEVTYEIFAPNQVLMDEARENIRQWMAEDREPQLDTGAIYVAKIMEIRDNGVVVILHPEMAPVLVPTGQLSAQKVGHPSALGMEIGMEIRVKYFGRDPKTGNHRISRKALVMDSPIGADLHRRKAQQETAGVPSGSPWSGKKKSY